MVTLVGLEQATLRSFMHTLNAPLPSEPLSSLRLFVYMTSCVRVLTFVARVILTNHLMGTVIALTRYWVCLCFILAIQRALNAIV